MPESGLDAANSGKKSQSFSLCDKPALDAVNR
jgi:hypothetical protein